MPDGPLQVIYEDNHLLAVNKPPRLPTMGVAAGTDSLLLRARQYIKHRYQKPGNVYLGVVSRLDADSSGAVLFARTSKAAARLTHLFRTRAVQKTYWALAAGKELPPSGEWIDWLIKDEARQRMRIVEPDHAGAKQARLRYRLLRKERGAMLVEIELLTGRKHQIRVQFASRGAPLAGERKYAPGAPFPLGIALHARRLVLEHPVRHEPLEIVAPFPPSWRSWGIA